MAKVYTGRDGLMKVNGTTLAKVVSFSVQSNLETLETTTLGDNLRSYTPGIVGFSGNATLLYYKADDGIINTTNVLNKLYKTGTSGVSDVDQVSFEFNWLDGADTNALQMNAYITSANIGAATGEIVRAEVAFQVTGALTNVTIGHFAD